jgi:hypothetical protein
MPAPGYSPSQLNFFKLTSIVLDKFPEALRHVFKKMWDKQSLVAWDDSVPMRDQLSVQEGYTPRIPTEKSYEEWDCSALFQATIYASTFEDPVTGQTLYDKHAKSSKPAKDILRKTVTSPTDDQDETFTLAIDQLRLIRNKFLHSCKTNVVDKAEFKNYITYAMAAFTALHYDTTKLDDISQLSESDLPIDIRADIPELEKRFEKERARDVKKRSYNISRNKAVIFIIPIVIAIVFAIYARLLNDSGKTWSH